MRFLQPRSRQNRRCPRPTGRATPPLALAALDGGPVRLHALRGHAVLLNFWASGCEPCREELPSLARLADGHATEGLSVLAINVREGADTVRRFVQQRALNLPVLLDAATREEYLMQARRTVATWLAVAALAALAALTGRRHPK